MSASVQYRPPSCNRTKGRDRPKPDSGIKALQRVESPRLIPEPSPGSGARINPLRCQIWVALQPDSRPKVASGGGETPWVAMSGNLRSCFAAFLVAGLSISPASSNPLADLFSAGPKQATAPAPAQEECLLQPGKLATDGQHWVYRSEGHRKCWFQTAEGAVAAIKKPVRNYVVKQDVTARERREAALRKRKADANARAEVLRSTPVEISHPAPPAPEFKVADTLPAPATGVAAVAPPASVAESSTDQLTPDRPTPRVVDVETVGVSSSASDTVTSPLPRETIPVAYRFAETGDDGWSWTATRLGVLLMALGLVSLLVSSLPVLFGLFSRSE
jgi:hypothetical protein